MSENLVRHTEEFAGQSVRQLKIFISRHGGEGSECGWDRGGVRGGYRWE